MEKTLINNSVNEKVRESEEMLNNIMGDKHATEEEFKNFMYRVNEVEKIVKKLASNDPEEQKLGETLADEILKTKPEKDFSEDELKVKVSRTVINKYKEKTKEEMSQEAFMAGIEKDAKERAENRKIRNERAETFKTIGNAAFKEGNYEKAVTFYSKALEQRKDSTVLWNNRAESYINLRLYEKALADCEWALKVRNGNLKALLNSAKCYKELGDENRYEEFIRLAREKNPHFNKFINEFEENIDVQIDDQT